MSGAGLGIGHKSSENIFASLLFSGLATPPQIASQYIPAFNSQKQAKQLQRELATLMDLWFVLRTHTNLMRLAMSSFPLRGLRERLSSILSKSLPKTNHPERCSGLIVLGCLLGIEPRSKVPQTSVLTITP